jgi:hypothetical protein
MTNENQAVDHTREELNQQIHDYKDDLLAIADRLERRALAASKAAAASRPKLQPPTLKEQALEILATAGGPDYPTQKTVLNTDEHILIRRALLPHQNLAVLSTNALGMLALRLIIPTKSN